MKKLIIVSSLLFPLMGMAADAVTPVYKTDMYALKISPNGKWIGSKTNYAGIYNVETGELQTYEGCYFGLGTTVANNGMAVGYSGEGGVIMKNGEILYPEAYEQYRGVDFNSVTPSATRVTGSIANPEKSETMSVPFVASIDSEGNIGEPILLPYPKEDFFQMAPQYVTAQCISNDGKTIVGLVTDWRGMFDYPIVYQEAEEGGWKYYLPSEALFNPTHIDIPESPWKIEPEYPEAANFMTGNRKTAYQEALAAGEDPDPKDYMSDEQYEEFVEAVEKYNEWYYSQEQKIREYVIIYDKILGTSPTFSPSELCINPSGETFMIHGGVINDENVMEGRIFEFSKDSLMREILAPDPLLFPTQILTDGTLLVTRPIQQVPNSYILMPGSTEFITLQEYLEPEYPEIAEWITEKMENGTGILVASDDMSVLAGGLIPDQLTDYPDNADFYYSSYILAGLASAGIESVISPENSGSYKVFNLQGLKVMETKEQSLLNTLPKGIYIINGKKAVIM